VEQGEVDEWLAHAVLAPVEQAERDDRRREEPDDRNRGPAELLPFDQCEREGEQRDREKPDSGEIQRLHGGGVLALRHEARGEDDADDPDGDVYEEDPAPAVGHGRPGHVLDDDAAEYRPEARGVAGGAPIAAPRLSAGKTVAMMLSVDGIMAAPPMPWTTRKAISR
jgi:hypothetical protein